MLDQPDLPQDDLNNSTFLNVHLWSDYPEVNDFICRIYTKFFEDKLKDARQKHLKVVLLHLYVVWRDDPTRYTAVHLNERKYRAKSRYNSLFISRLTIPIVKELARLNLVTLQRGYFLTDNDGRNRCSRIRPTEKLMEEFKAARFRIFDIQIHKDSECIVLRDEEKNDIEYQDTDKTVRMRSFLRLFNYMLRHAHIDCSHLDQSSVTKSDGSIIQVEHHHKFVKRIFSRGSWTQGGRFYGGFWQNIPKEHRKYIRIDGERTVETDFKGLHITLLYAQKGIHYFDQYGFRDDPYKIHIPNVRDEQDRRWLIKSLLLTAVNAGNEREAFRAFQKEANFEGRTINGVRFTFDFLRSVLHALRKKHQPIADMLCSGVGIDLQYTDSQITERILQHFARDGVVVLPVHDSYIIAERHSESLRRAMYNSWAIEAGMTKDDSVAAHLNLYSGFTAVEQKGYVDELYSRDIVGHKKIMAEKVEEYVSPRYQHGLKEFQHWLERTV